MCFGWACVLIDVLLIKGEPSKIVEPSFFLCVPRVYIWVGADGIVVPRCLRYVVCQTSDPGGVVVIEVESCCCFPYRYDLDTPFVAWEKSFLADSEEGVNIGEIGSWYISERVAEVRVVPG